MKLKLLTALAFSCIYVGQAQAIQCAIVPKFDLNKDPGYNNCFNSMTAYHGPLVIPISCAPEVESNNLQTLEHVLIELSNHELKESQSLKDLISEMRIVDNRSKMNGLLKIIDIQTDNDLIAFLGSREIPEKQIRSLQLNTDLNEEGAKLVLQKVTTSLLGQRK